jgi:hypothetical protein
MATFLSITSEGGNFGRIKWSNTCQARGKVAFWGSFHFEQQPSKPWPVAIPRHPMCRSSVLPIRSGQGILLMRNETGYLIPSGSMMTSDGKTFPPLKPRT